MANQSITSMVALHNQHLDVAEELHSWDWEVVEGQDLYADVESLDSFSVSSRDEEVGQEQEYERIHADRDGVCSQCDDCEVATYVLGGNLEVTTSEDRHHRNRNHGFDSDGGAIGDWDKDDVDFDDDMVGEPHDRDAVAMVDPLGLHISGGRVDVCDVGNPVLDLDVESNGLNHGNRDEDDVDDGFTRERQALLHLTVVMFARSGEYVFQPHNLHSNYVENNQFQDFLDQRYVLKDWDARNDEDNSNGVGDNGFGIHDNDDGDCGYEIDVDDELVPWGVANRLAKQRMKKLGKRTFARMNKSKKMAHFYIKPACLHGKHGLGLKTY